MTLEDLRAFVFTYRAGSMSEAARRLGCTQAAVAHHVRRLERELGTELFSRLRRGVAPTERGRVLFGAADAALNDLGAAVGEIVRLRERSAERLRLAVSSSIATLYLRKAILAFQEQRPGVTVEIEPHDTAEDRLAALRAGRADLALVPLVESLGNLEARVASEIALGLVVHPTHPLATQDRVALRDLASIRYIAQSPSSSTYRHVESALRETGISLSPCRTVEDAPTAVLMVELGHGETFAPARQASGLERSKRVKVVPVPDLPPVRMGWVARDYSLLPHAAQAFVDFCEDVVAAG